MESTVLYMFLMFAYVHFLKFGELKKRFLHMKYLQSPLFPIAYSVNILIGSIIFYIYIKINIFYIFHREL